MGACSSLAARVPLSSFPVSLTVGNGERLFGLFATMGRRFVCFACGALVLFV